MHLVCLPRWLRWGVGVLSVGPPSEKGLSTWKVLAELGVSAVVTARAADEARVCFGMFHAQTKKKPRALPVGLCSAALSSLVTVEQCRSFEEEEVPI